MPAVNVTTNANQVSISLQQFQLSLGQRERLMQTIGAGQLVSIYRTFDEEGSPSGSWAPLAQSTLRGKRYTAGHKLLIISGRLRNSINAQSSGNSVTIGTSVVYARVQQLGSGAGKVKVAKHHGSILLAHSYAQREVKGHDGKSYMVPTPVRTGKHLVVNRNGKTVTVKAKLEGPRRLKSFDVAAHERTGGIPARPFLVFRPEDPARILEQAKLFAENAAANAGLYTSSGGAA